MIFFVCVFTYICICAHIFVCMCMYSWLLNNVGLNGMGLLIHGFFFYKYLYCFPSVVESLWVQRSDYMHWYMPFYVGYLSIPGVWYSRRFWNKYSTDTEVQVKLGESQKLYVDSWLHRGQCPQPQCCWRVNCIYICLCVLFFSIL